MSPALWRDVESDDPYFVLWWVICLIASWLLAKEPGYYGSKLHALVNDRIFLQGVRHKGQESSLVSRGWSLMAYAILGLILAGTVDFQASWTTQILKGSGRVLFLVLGWALLLGTAVGLWAGLLRLLAWIAEFEEGFLWLKASFNLFLHVLIPALLLIALVLRFGTQPWVQMSHSIALGLMAMAIGFRWLRLLVLAKELSMNRLFLLIFYICTFELIPVLVIVSNQTHG